MGFARLNISSANKRNIFKRTRPKIRQTRFYKTKKMHTKDTCGTITQKAFLCGDTQPNGFRYSSLCAQKFYINVT